MPVIFHAGTKNRCPRGKNQNSHSGHQNGVEIPSEMRNGSHLASGQELPQSVGCWTKEHVATWLELQGFEEYIDLLVYQHKIDGQTLLLLNESDLRQPPLQLSILADLKKIAVALDNLRNRESALNDANMNLRGNNCNSTGPMVPTMTSVQSTPHMANLHKADVYGFVPDSPLSPDTIDVNFDTPRIAELVRRSSEPHLNKKMTKDEFIRQVESVDTYKKALLKVFIAGIYCQVALLVTSTTMVIVHDRVPDMTKYPPLPDLVLDNLPYIPWAFEVCEMLASVMMFIWITMLIFHKHRLIILRRAFSLVGTVFLLRSVTMLITSLSVPGVHLECAAQTYIGLKAKLLRALEIWSGLGMTIQGVRTCGDYMFSGHTTAVTLLNHFITEYTPDSWRGLHTATWVMNLFGIFFILAGHEHYSIDVFIAFYISSRMFLYYHVLASQISTHTFADERVRGWFPFLWFFESGSPSRLENEFELPLPNMLIVSTCLRNCRDWILRSYDAWTWFVKPRANHVPIINSGQKQKLFHQSGKNLNQQTNKCKEQNKKKK